MASPDYLSAFLRLRSLGWCAGNLELISTLYNNILSTLLDVERPLVASKLEAIDAGLHKGLNTLNWNR